jgi:hypothetical protein
VFEDSRGRFTVDWSWQEIDLIIADYMAMLTDELRGKSYNKSAHRRALKPLLHDRTDGSIERKHQNISAVLITLGYPYIPGYKPLGNYQALLREHVAAYLERRSDIGSAIGEAMELPATEPTVVDYLGRLEDPPRSSEWAYSEVRDRPAPSLLRPRVDYLQREARNASLGLAGERFVINYERARLTNCGCRDLATRVEHISQTCGDGVGFDVRSFEPDGTERLIEVKTTAGGKQTPFYVSRNELEVSRENVDRYHLYRVFGFRRDARLYAVRGAIDQVFSLEPTQFTARIA